MIEGYRRVLEVAKSWARCGGLVAGRRVRVRRVRRRRRRRRRRGWQLPLNSHLPAVEFLADRRTPGSMKGPPGITNFYSVVRDR